MQATTKFSDSATAIKSGTYVFVYERPALVGSPKQAQWAEKIRANAEKRVMTQLLAGIARAGGPKINADIFSDSPDQSSTINEWLDKVQAGKRLGDMLQAALSNTSAKYWIEDGEEVSFVSAIRPTR